MRGFRYPLVLAALALAGCGQMAELKPAPGQSLPAKPAMARTTPTAEQLLTPPTYAKPERIDELIKRSQPRKTDRFDLPPPSGGEAPTPPTEPTTASEQAGPATPQ
jgi:hypothetical protein